MKPITRTQVSNSFRAQWFAIFTFAAMLLLFQNNRSALAAAETLTIANHSIENINVAYGTMNASTSDSGEYATVSRRLITYSGWHTIEPGTTQEFPVGAWLHVEQDGRRVFWPGIPQTTGVLLRSGAFANANVEYDGSSVPQPDENNLGQLLKQGYERGAFQELPQGYYRVPGSAVDNKKEALIQAFTASRTADTGAGGIVTLGTGLPSGTHSINVLAMGTRAASSLRSECPGYVGSHPSARLIWSGSTPELTIFASSSEDTTLVIKDPSGDYHCNDDWTDGSTADPMVHFNSPDEGGYAIWVGKYDIGGTADAELHFSERGVLIPTALEK